MNVPSRLIHPDQKDPNAVDLEFDVVCFLLGLCYTLSILEDYIGSVLRLEESCRAMFAGSRDGVL